MPHLYCQRLAQLARMLDDCINASLAVAIFRSATFEACTDRHGEVQLGCPTKLTTSVQQIVNNSKLHSRTQGKIHAGNDGEQQQGSPRLPIMAVFESDISYMHQPGKSIVIDTRIHHPSTIWLLDVLDEQRRSASRQRRRARATLE